MLHVFADSSESGYGAVIYIVTKNGIEEKKHSMLVISKAKLAPVKKITLPRLELLACLVASRLLKVVKKALNLPEIHYKCYTDSQIALHWIKGDANRYKPFVANRVQEIQDLIDPSSWSHVAGKENPADLLTRGLSAVSLKGSSVWIKGSVF
jgi:hypothetical protein